MKLTEIDDLITTLKENNIPLIGISASIDRRDFNDYVLPNLYPSSYDQPYFKFRGLRVTIMGVEAEPTLVVKGG